ncbi:MAG: glucose-1-phosphate adenylyltransferase [Candidatus Hydrogenedentes bacterium]|nr:glucose-1-phosphate adenylyltransferase [Candidatus Hydrogenedentota bacterium]
MIPSLSDVDVLQCAERVVALVLGGGQGSRLYPLTAERAKPAVPLCGRYRLVDIPLSNCIHSGIRRIFVLTQFNSASLNRHITKCYTFDSFSKGFVEILAAEQTDESGGWFQGTADAVRQHLRHICRLGASQYLVLSGDQLYRMDYRALMATHLHRKADITVAVLPVDRRAASGFGILKVREDGRIVDFVEKPKRDDELGRLVTAPTGFGAEGIVPGAKEYLASMGVYIFRPEVLEAILREKREWVDFGHDVIPKSLGTHDVHAHLFTDFWEDIGTVRSYYEASMSMTRPDPPFQFHEPDRPIYTRPRYLPGTLVHDSSITDSIICEGCRISRAQISHSIIGIRTIIMPDVTVDRSVIMGADFYRDESATPGIPIGIGQGSCVSGAIVDKNACIGTHVVIRGADGLEDGSGEGFDVRDGIVVVRKNAVIRDGARIGAVK